MIRDWKMRRHDLPVALKLIYQMFAKVLSWMVLRTRSDAAKEIEILLLRHQLAVLQRRRPRPRINWTHRAVIASLARLLPAPRRRGLLVTPATILRRVGHGRGCPWPARGRALIRADAAATTPRRRPP